MNGGVVNTAESVYLVLRDYLGSEGCPWDSPSGLVLLVQDCSGPEKCVFGRHCRLCKYVAAFSNATKTAILGEIEELRWEIRANRGETALKCPLCGIIKTAVSDGHDLCLNCAKTRPIPLAAKAEKAAEVAWTETLEAQICLQQGSH